MNKLKYEDKVNLYYDRKNRIPLSTISKKYKTTVDNIQFLEKLIDKHGFEILTTRKKYSKFEKEQVITRVINGESIISVTIDEGIKSKSLVSHWVSKYKENGYNMVERKKGRSTMKKTTSKKEVNQVETDKEKIKRLEEENLYLKAELEYSKKLRAVVQARKNQQQKKK